MEGFGLEEGGLPMQSFGWLEDMLRGVHPSTPLSPIHHGSTRSVASTQTEDTSHGMRTADLSEFPILHDDICNNLGLWELQVPNRFKHRHAHVGEVTYIQQIAECENVPFLHF